ncbi:hypothetical protein FA15DRAFT_671726 [Coprinopsis marcescibilis]|uniref:Uncharacterized protein n=1 Tax=Coprinopsis marcescibilis TaxID=230819 RepID=A0A5C3KPL8_COPMA|nr:hypothetical protein FA15DRAFT_671726 [Coprinopsis marcescibilis]
MAEVTWYILDDRSPAIQWAPPGAWLSHSAGREHNGTSTMSLVPDASVTLTFNGTGIQVFGTITGQVNHEGTPAFQYTIRDADNNEVAGDFWPGSGPTVFNYRAIEETALFPGLHTLAITNQSPDGMFRFDYFRITGTMLPEHNLTATDVTTLSPGGGEPVTSTVFAIPTGDLGRGDRSGEQGAQGVNVATLVVASIASVAFIVGLVILVIFLVRRRRKKRAVIEAGEFCQPQVIRTHDPKPC